MKLNLMKTALVALVVACMFAAVVGLTGVAGLPYAVSMGTLFVSTSLEYMSLKSQALEPSAHVSNLVGSAICGGVVGGFLGAAVALL